MLMLIQVCRSQGHIQFSVFDQKYPFGGKFGLKKTTKLTG